MITTAGGAATNYVIRSGYGDFPLNSGDWTIFIHFKYPGTPTGHTNCFLLSAGMADYSNPYVWMGSSINTSDVFAEASNDGVVFNDTPTHAITNGAQNWGAVTYNHTTHTITLILNGSTIGTTTCDLSAITFDRLLLLGDELVASNSDDTSIAYCRAWSSILTSAELMAEAASITAVSSTGLLFDNPLQASIDLTAHNNTLNQFTATGTVTTDTTDPLLSVVAGPPTNIDPNTATTVDYNTAVFQDTLTAGAATDVWFKATALTGDKVWGACAFGDLVTYKPLITVYASLADALANSIYVTALGGNQPIQFSVTAGNTYYFKAARNGAVTPAVLKLSILRGLTITVPVGSLAIPDVSSGFPLVFLDNTTGYPINWQTDFPSGENVGILQSTNVLVEDSTTHGVKLYNNLGSQLIATPAVSANYEIIGSNLVSYVVALDNVTTSHFVLVDGQGTVGGTTYDVTGHLLSITLNPDSTIAYIEQNQSLTNQAVKKYVLATSTLSTFVAGIANYILAPNLIGISDGTVLVGYNRAAVDAKVLRYNADGTTANTYDLSSDDQIERLAIDINAESTDFWVWSQPTNQYSRFYKIKLSDGTKLVTINNVQKFDDGRYQAGADTNTPVRFGHSFSCPLWITAVVVASRSGIYYLTGTSPSLSTQRHDTLWIDASLGTSEDVAIP